MLVSIDDRGNIALGPVLAPSTLSAVLPDQQSLQDFLIRNVGYIVMAIQPHGAVLRWRPEIVSDETLAALLYAVHDLGIFRLLFKTFDGSQWRHRIIKRNSNEFFELMVTEAKELGDLDGIDWAMRQRASCGRVGSSSAMQLLLDYWKLNKAKSFLLDNGELKATLSQVGGNRYCVVRATDPGELIVTAIGSGFMRPIEIALLPCVGRSLTSLPDARFGSFCAKAYGEAATSAEPIIEEIDTFIRISGHRPIRRRYMRAILPLRTASESWLLGISFDDPSINLRIGSA